MKFAGMGTMTFIHQQDDVIFGDSGTGFGSCGEGFVRCSYATSMEEIEEAMRRIKDFIATLRK